MYIGTPYKKKREIYLFSTTSEIPNYSFAFRSDASSSRPLYLTMIVRDENDEIIIKKIVAWYTGTTINFDFSNHPGKKKVFVYTTESRLKRTRYFFNNQQANTLQEDDEFLYLIPNVTTYWNTGATASVGVRGVSGIPETLTKIENFRVYESANEYFDTIPLIQTLTDLHISGINRISHIPELLNLVYLNLTGQNTVAEIPSTLVALTSLTLTGQNTVAEIPSALIALTSVQIRGNHQITANLSDTQFHNLIRIELSLNNSNIGTPQGDISYTNSRIWPNNMQAVILKPETGGLTTDENQVAQLLIDLSKSTWSTTSVLYRIVIRGNALPPAPSQELTDALNLLDTKGVAVYTN